MIRTNPPGGMKRSHRFSTALLTICVFAPIASPSFGMISIGVLTKDKARDKYGITMHARRNGDAGVKVWLEFKREGWLEKFTYAELRVQDKAGKHLLSAQLQPNPVHHRRAKDVTTVSFSADADQLEKCSFLVVCYGSIEGDVGYYLRVKDFFDLDNRSPKWLSEVQSDAPLTLALPDERVELTIMQRRSKPLPGSGGRIIIALDDITGGQVVVSVRSNDGDVLLADVSMEQGDVVTFRVGEEEYFCHVRELKNFLTGQDIAIVEVASSREALQLLDEQGISEDVGTDKRSPE